MAGSGNHDEAVPPSSSTLRRRFWRAGISAVFLTGVVAVVLHLHAHSVNSYVRALSGGTPQEQDAAAHALATEVEAEDLRTALPALIQGLGEGRMTAPADCAEALGKLGPSAAEALPRLAELVERAEVDGWQSAATRSMAKIGPASLPYFLRWLRGNRPYLHKHALVGLAALGWEPRTDEDRAWLLAAEGRWQGVLALGAAAKAVVRTHVVQVPSTEGEEEQNGALVKALDSSGDDALPFLVDFLLDPPPCYDSSIRPVQRMLMESVAARSSSAYLGAAASGLMAALRSTDDGDPCRREDLVDALLALASGMELAGDDAADPVLTDLLSCPERSVQLAVSEALWECGVFSDLPPWSGDSAVSQPQRCMVLPNFQQYDLALLLPEELRAATLPDADFLILVRQYSEEDPAWYWSTGSELSVYGSMLQQKLRPARRLVLEIGIADKARNLHLRKCFVGGIIVTRGDILVGGVEVTYVDQPVQSMKVAREAAAWVVQQLGGKP